MKKTITENPDEQNEIKTRIPLWLYPSTLAAVDRSMAVCNCKSRSEYLEKAALFYAGYVSGEDACAYLPTAMTKAVRGAIQDTENRICRLLFKLAVELDMIMNILAADREISDEVLEGLRVRCVREVKATSGTISLKDAMRYQHGTD
jgi:hypothetical protein